MRAVVILFAVSLTVPLLTAQGRAAESPTVDQILARYEHAMGGKAQFKKITSMVFRGTIEFPSNHLSGTTAEYFKSPDHFLTITEVPGYGTLRTVYDGTSAWTEDPKRGVIDIGGPALADMSSAK
jgi:outer membrane lipoprotein-sorting protein